MKSSFPGKKIDDYVLTNVIGKGAFGEVYEAQNINSKQTVAVKSVPKIKLKEHNGLVGELLQTEVQVLMYCNNENVVKLIKYLESDNNCYIVMEFCNEGDFEKLWEKRKKKIPEKEAIDFLKQLLNGMKGLHEQNVIHRDLKLANILIDKGVIKIADLGFAKRLNNKDELVKSALGTLGTMAPEVIEFKNYGLLVDMFSIGAIYYQMLFGVLPFSTKNYDAFLNDVKNRKPDFQKNGIRISAESQDLLTQMLLYDPRYRMKWNVIYDHKLFQSKEGFQALNQITIASIAARQVDMGRNNDLYKKNQNQLDQINDKNMIANIQQRGKIPQPMLIQEEEQKQQDFEKANQIQQQNRLIQCEIDRVVNLYLSKRNTFLFLARVIDQIQRFQHSKYTNVYLPVFILLKKLLIQTSELLQNIEKHTNIFKCVYFGKLYENDPFLNFVKMLKDEKQVIGSHFDITLNQMKEILQNMPNPNQEILSELSPYSSPKFEENYKSTLLNYYIQLQDEKSQDENQKLNLLCHILDAAVYNNLFLNEVMLLYNSFNRYKSMLSFEIESYFNQFDYYTDQEKNKLLEEKFNQAFI